MVPFWCVTNDKKIMYESGIAVKKAMARAEEKIKESRFREEIKKRRKFLMEKELKKNCSRKLLT